MELIDRSASLVNTRFFVEHALKRIERNKMLYVKGLLVASLRFTGCIQDLNNLWLEIKEEPEVLRFLIYLIVANVIVWTILNKAGFLDEERKVKKAIANNRVIVASLNEKHISEAEYYGVGTWENYDRFFKYRYIHPTTGKEKKYK